MQDTSSLTPIKQMILTEQTCRSTQQHFGEAKNPSLPTAKTFLGSMKMSEYSTEAIFNCANDPIFQMSSPNVSSDIRGNGSTNPFVESCFKTTSILASSRKHYNNNLFLTPLKEDDRRKPAYFNSIFNLLTTHANISDYSIAKRLHHSISSHSSPLNKKEDEGQHHYHQDEIHEEPPHKQQSYKKPSASAWKSDAIINEVSKSEKTSASAQTNEHQKISIKQSNATQQVDKSHASSQSHSQPQAHANANLIIQQGSNTATANSGNEMSKKQKTCNCKKTKCLKLYCDCFAAGELCGVDCNCFGCFNTPTNETRANAICNIMDRQPDAFGPKVQSNTHKKGCHCARSGCLKKYCECYTLGVNCGEYCKCYSCKNVGLIHESKKEGISKDIEELEQISSKKKKIFLNSTSSSLNLIQKVSQEEAKSDENDDIEEEEEDGAYETKVEGIAFFSPSSSKMYTTPCKQPNSGEGRSLTTAETAKKQIYSYSGIDSEMKNHIVKLSNREDASEFNLKSKKKQIGVQQSKSLHSNISSHSDEDNIHSELKKGVIQISSKQSKLKK